MPLDYLALEASGGAYMYGSPGNVTIRKTTLGRLLLLGHCTGSRLQHSLTFPAKRPVCLSWSSGLRVQLLVCYTYRSPQKCSQKHRLADTTFVISLYLAPVRWYLPEMSLRPCLVPRFQQLLPGDTSISPGSGDQQASIHGSHRTVTQERMSS